MKFHGKTKYIDPTQEIDTLLNKSLQSKHQISLMNGNMKIIKLNKKRY